MPQVKYFHSDTSDFSTEEELRVVNAKLAKNFKPYVIIQIIIELTLLGLSGILFQQYKFYGELIHISRVVSIFLLVNMLIDVTDILKISHSRSYTTVLRHVSPYNSFYFWWFLNLIYFWCMTDLAVIFINSYTFSSMRNEENPQKPGGGVVAFFVIIDLLYLLLHPLSYYLIYLKGVSYNSMSKTTLEEEARY